MADRLALAHALEDGGFRRDAAERIATIIARMIRSGVGAAPDLPVRQQRVAEAFAQAGVDRRKAGTIAAAIIDMVRERHG